MDVQEERKQCRQCTKIKPLSAFYKQKNTPDKHMHHCIDCYKVNREEYQRQAPEREKQWERIRMEEEERQKKLAEEFERQLEAWYTEQPDQICARCKRKRTAKEMGIWGEDWPIWDEKIIRLRETCKDCRYDQCCLCLKKKYRVLSSFNGYSLTIPGTSHRIKLFCEDCEPAFLALPIFRQKMLIRTCCHRTFPPGQVVYGEKDPRTQEIRYVGRTSNATRRHAEHMRNASPELSGIGEYGTERYKEYYGRRAWMYDLKQLGLKPIQVLLPWPDILPQVVEWEKRYIWHALQQDWPITNHESAVDDLTRNVKDSGLDFLKAPFETLVEHGFFREKGIEAFVHKWYKP